MSSANPDWQVPAPRSILKDLVRIGYPAEWVNRDECYFVLPWYPLNPHPWYDRQVHRVKTAKGRARTVYRLWQFSINQPEEFEARMVMEALYAC